MVAKSPTFFVCTAFASCSLTHSPSTSGIWDSSALALAEGTTEEKTIPQTTLIRMSAASTMQTTFFGP